MLFRFKPRETLMYLEKLQVDIENNAPIENILTSVAHLISSL